VAVVIDEYLGEELDASVGISIDTGFGFGVHSS
jgi:hypothetical protein